MKTAIPIVGTWVSPRFDCGAALLVAEINDGVVTSRQVLPDAASNALQRVARLRELGVDLVVCGAITGFLLRHLAANAIRVFPWVSGEASEVLDALARGELAARLPGAAGPGKGRGRGRWGHCWRGPRWSRRTR